MTRIIFFSVVRWPKDIRKKIYKDDYRLIYILAERILLDSLLFAYCILPVER